MGVAKLRTGSSVLGGVCGRVVCYCVALSSIGDVSDAESAVRVVRRYSRPASPVGAFHSSQCLVSYEYS